MSVLRYLAVALLALAGTSALSCPASSRPVYFANAQGEAVGHGYLLAVGKACFVLTPHHVVDAKGFPQHSGSFVVSQPPSKGRVERNIGYEYADLDISLLKVVEGGVSCPESWFGAGEGSELRMTNPERPAVLLFDRVRMKHYEPTAARAVSRTLTCLIYELNDLDKRELAPTDSGSVVKDGATLLGILLTTGSQPGDDSWLDERCRKRSDAKNNSGDKQDVASTTEPGDSAGHDRPSAAFLSFAALRSALDPMVGRDPALQSIADAELQSFSAIVLAKGALDRDNSESGLLVDRTAALTDLRKGIEDYRANCLACRNLDEANRMLRDILEQVAELAGRESSALETKKKAYTDYNDHCKSTLVECPRRGEFEDRLERIKGQEKAAADRNLWEEIQAERSLSEPEKVRLYLSRCPQFGCGLKNTLLASVRIDAGKLKGVPITFAEEYCHEHATHPLYSAGDNAGTRGTFKGLAMTQIAALDRKVIDSAVKACLEAASLYPRYGRPIYELSRIYEAIGQLTVALNYAEQAERFGDLHAYYTMYDVYGRLRNERKVFQYLYLAASHKIYDAPLKLGDALLESCQDLVSVFRQNGQELREKDCDSRAAAIFLELHEAGNGRGTYRLGWLYARRRGVSDCLDSAQCDGRAVRLYREAYLSTDANKQEVAAQLGWMYDRKRGVGACQGLFCEKEAIRYYREAKLPWTKRNLARMYLDQRGVEECSDRQGCDRIAQDLFLEAAPDDAEAKTWLAWMYDSGRAIGCDEGQSACERKAVELYQEASDNGIGWATRNLASMYLQMRGVTDCATQEGCDHTAHRLYAAAAPMDSDAEAWLGWTYDHRRGVDCAQDACDISAVAHYRNASVRGEAWATRNLGLMYQERRGVTDCDSDATCLLKAVDYLTQAAVSDGMASSRLADLLIKDGAKFVLCPLDECAPRAADYYRRAGEQGEVSGAQVLVEMLLARTDLVCGDPHDCAAMAGFYFTRFGLEEKLNPAEIDRIWRGARLCTDEKSCAIVLVAGRLGALGYGSGPISAESFGDNHDAVVVLQELLKLKGLYDGTVDGKIGDRTIVGARTFVANIKATLPQEGSGTNVQ